MAAGTSRTKTGFRLVAYCPVCKDNKVGVSNTQRAATCREGHKFELRQGLRK